MAMLAPGGMDFTRLLEMLKGVPGKAQGMAQGGMDAARQGMGQVQGAAQDFSRGVAGPSSTVDSIGLEPGEYAASQSRPYQAGNAAGGAASAGMDALQDPRMQAALLAMLGGGAAGYGVAQAGGPGQMMGQAGDMLDGDVDDQTGFRSYGMSPQDSQEMQRQLMLMQRQGRMG